jgi:hypothetical protein
MWILKKKKTNNALIILCFFLSLSNIIPLSIGITTDPDSGTKTLSYSEYVIVDSDRERAADFHWEFKSSKSHIGIIVLGMDDEGYDNFKLNYSAGIQILSDGSKSEDSDTWEITYKDMWYIVFLNNDTDKESTTLTYSVEKYKMLDPMLIFVIVLVISLSVLSGLTPYIVKKLKSRKSDQEVKKYKKKSKKFFDSIEEAPIDLTEPSTALITHCPFCGKEVKDTSEEICEFCGSNLLD